MKTTNRYDIRATFDAHLINPGDLVYMHPDSYPPYNMQRLRVAIAQIIARLPYTASIRTIDHHIMVRRDTPEKKPTLPGMEADISERDILLSFRPWPDDPLYDEKTRFINERLQTGE